MRTAVTITVIAWFVVAYLGDLRGWRWRGRKTH